MALGSSHIEVPSKGRLADPVAWRSTAAGEAVESAIATMRPAGVDASGTRGGARGAALEASRARPGAVALRTLSSLALFVAATFQAASQRPSVVVRFFPPSTPSPRAPRSLRAAVPNPPPRSECPRRVLTPDPNRNTHSRVPAPVPSHPSVAPQSIALLALFGAERIAASVRPARSSRLTPTELAVWRRVLSVSAAFVACECVVQACYAAFGPDWPRRRLHRDALRWAGFAELSGAGQYLAEFMPFFVVLAAAAAQLFLHRVAAFRDADDPGAHRLPTDASATRTDSAASGLGLHPTSPSPPPAWAVPAAACLALAASVSVPSFAGFPYFFVVVAGATLYGAETHDPLTPLSARRIRNAARRRRGWFARWRGGDANRRGGGVASGLRVAPAISRGFLRAALGYVATHFSLLYLYQLPELTARADGVRAKWLGLYVLAETDRPTVTALKLTQLVALAGLYACLCAAGAMRGGDDDDSRPRRRAGSARAIIPPLGGGVRREDDGLEAPLLDGGDGCDVSSVEPSLVSEEDDGDAPWAPRVARPVDDFGPESVFADAHDDDLDGARMEDDARSAFSGAETRRAAPIPVPSVPRRLLAKYTGTLASFVIVATSLAAKNLLAYPVLAYALVSITSRPKHGAFARRHGPLILVYLAVWCVTEYAYISVPDAVLPEATHRRGQLLRAVGLYRVDADRADAAGPGYIGSLFVTLAAAAALLNQARMTPTEEELEEALRAVGGGGLPPGFVRLDAADDDKPPPPATFERGDDADARGGAAEEAAAYASASANGGTAEEVAAAAYASANAAAARRGRRANVVEPAVPGWERPALAVLSNLLVPLALWIVALSNDDLLHAALLLAFLLTLVWPGDRSVLANTGRVIAGGLALMYLWSLDSIPDLTGINRPEWKPALRLLGLWQPDLIRAMIPMACILVINCVVLNLPEVVEALQPLEDEDAEAEAGIAARTAGTATARAETEGVTAEAVWALVSAAAAEVWLTAVALADGGGAYGVLLLGLCIVEVTDCCLLNLALLGLLGFALIVPMPSNPKDERNSPRWRALLGFALANLAARYAFGAYPLARSLGLSEPAQRFLHRTVGLAPNLPRNELMSQLLGPSALVIVTHFHRVGALSSASFGGEVGGGFGVGSSGSGGRPVPLPVASNQTGVFPFLRRVAVLHSGKVLTLAALYFSVRHVDVFGAAMLAGAGALCVASKTAAAPAEILGGIAVATAFANYALAVRWMHDEALIHQNILEWVGLRRWDPPRQMFWPKHEEMLRGAVLVLAALELARASRAWFAELPPALKTGCAPEPCHLFWPVPGASAVERGFRVKDKRVKGRGGGRGRGEGEEKEEEKEEAKEEEEEEAKEEEEEEAKEEEEEAKKEATASASATTATATTTSSRRRLVEGTGPGTAPRPRSNPDPTTTTTTVIVDVDATWTRAWANFAPWRRSRPGIWRVRWRGPCPARYTRRSRLSRWRPRTSSRWCTSAWRRS